MPARYFLKDSAYTCSIGETRIVLDTAQDKYFFFNGRQAGWFSELADTGPAPCLSPKAVLFGDRLCERGILARAPGAARVTREPPAEGALKDLSVSGKVPVHLRDVLAFLTAFACLRGLQDPGRRNLSLVLAEVQRWKQAARRRRRAPDRAAHRVMYRDGPALARIFHALTPWFFCAHDACFFRSVLLIRFLSGYGVEADWTFAVRVSPFRAHCWVSCDGVLLNEDKDVADGFKPILTV